MSFAKYVIIENINNNFGKLLVNCTDGITYTPPNYNLPQNYDAFIVLNQLIELSCKIKHQGNTIDNIVLSRILDNLISSKCIQFTNLPEIIQQGVNNENFKNSFMNYLSELVKNYLDEFNSSMQF